MPTRIDRHGVRRWHPRKSLACTRSGPSCIAEFATGHVGTGDFCPACVSKMIIAFDWVAGEDLRWDESFIARIEGAPEEYQIPADVQPGGWSR